MTDSASQFFSAIAFAWASIFFFHQVIGGLIGIFTRGVIKKNKIIVAFKEED